MKPEVKKKRSPMHRKQNRQGHIGITITVDDRLNITLTTIMIKDKCPSEKNENEKESNSLINLSVLHSRSTPQQAGFARTWDVACRI